MFLCDQGSLGQHEASMVVDEFTANLLLYGIES